MPQPSNPNYDLFNNAFSSPPTQSSSSALHQPSQNSTPQQPPKASPQSAPKADPFDILASAGQQKPAATPPGNSIFNFSSALPASASQSHNGTTAADDEFEFSSAVPEEETPRTSVIDFNHNELDITFEVSRPEATASAIHILAKLSNKGKEAITEFTFQVAVTKVG